MDMHINSVDEADGGVTNNAIVRWTDLGHVVQDSKVLVDDSGDMTFPHQATLSLTGSGTIAGVDKFTLTKPDGTQAQVFGLARKVIPTANPQWVEISDGTTLQGPHIRPEGPAANINLSLDGKGTGGVNLEGKLDVNTNITCGLSIFLGADIWEVTGTRQQLKFSDTASAINELTIKNNSAGNDPELQATGDDTDIGLNLVSKGSGTVQVNGTAIASVTTAVLVDGTTALTADWDAGLFKVTFGDDVHISDGGGLVIGHTAKVDFGAIPEFQVLGTGAPDSSCAFGRWSNNAGGATLRFLKSRNATIGSLAIVQDGDELGRIRFQADDGTDYNTNAAEISAEVDGTPGFNDMPGRLLFSTTNNGSSSVTEKMRLTNDGKLGIGLTNPAERLDLGSGNLLTTGNVTANLIPNAEMDAGAHTIGFTAQSATGDGTTTIDWKLGNKFNFTFGSQNDTFTFTAPTNPCNLILKLIQDGTGSRTATWPSTVKWAGGTAPTLTTTASAVDIIAFYFDGTNYHGTTLLDSK